MIGQFKKVILLIIIAFSWISCSEDTEYEIVDSEDILPQSQGVYEYDNDSLDQVEIALNQTEEVLVQLYPEVSFDEENPLRDREMLFIPNRLGYKNKEETFFTKDSIPYHFIAWEFEDSLKTVNAFYNWLDCFGHDCRSLRIEDEVNASKEAFVIWVSDSKITYIASNKYVKRKAWESVFFNDLNNEWNFIIQQGPRGKMKWTIFND